MCFFYSFYTLNSCNSFCASPICTTSLEAARGGWKLLISDTHGIAIISATWWHNHTGCQWGPYWNVKLIYTTAPLLFGITIWLGGMKTLTQIALEPIAEDLESKNILGGGGYTPRPSYVEHTYLVFISMNEAMPTCYSPLFHFHVLLWTQTQDTNGGGLGMRL